MTGYIQIELNGKAVGLKFSMYAMEVLSQLRKDTGTFANTVNMVWAGYAGNCFAKKTDEQLSFEEISEWVETIYLDGDKDGIIGKIAEAFISCQAYQKLTEKVETEQSNGIKKKKTGSESMSMSLAKSA